jgi:O-antigen/teichoic acid export membrane protein
MNLKVKEFAKNFSYTVLVNVITLLITAILTLIVPKFFGTKEFAYWQLYVFYLSYVGFFHFGWADGVYLRYGGEKYDGLDQSKFVTQFWLFVLLQSTIGIIFTVFLFLIKDADKSYTLLMTIIYGIIVNPRYLLLFVLQGTNRIKAYAKIMLLDRILFTILVLLILIIGNRDYKSLIIADVISRGISMIYTMYICKEIVFGKLSPLKGGFVEAWDNISVGIQLMLANIASNFIIGIVRIGIERKWGIEAFGKISLTISISNLLLNFINSISVVIFPLLRRSSKESMSQTYLNIRSLLMASVFGMLLVYQPARSILSIWLPQYAESLKYMVLLFPICVFESKTALLTNTYLKTLRKEKYILLANVTAVLLSLFFVAITVFTFKSLTMSIISVVVLVAFKSIYAEILISRILSLHMLKDIFVELGMTIIFITCGWFISGWLNVLIYFVAYFIYLIINRSNILLSVKRIKSL